MTLVAVPLSAAAVDTLLADTHRAQAAGADLVEWRLDTAVKLGADPLALIAAIPRSPLPVLVTVRHANEKGDWNGTEAERFALLAAADQAGAAYIDVELAHDQGWRPAHARLILSSHDFSGMGEDLVGKLAEMERRGAIAKVAVTARDASDLNLVRDLLLAKPGKRIVLAMGEHGLSSRLLAGVWGGLLTFARLPDQAGSAPGQPSVSDLVGLYRLHAQRPGWRIFGVVGNPIGHSLSPHLHNPCLAQVGAEAVYVPLLVTDFARFWADCGAWIAGLSVTIPHKEALLAVGGANGWVIEDAPRRIGAANTLYRAADGAPRLANTDAVAIRTLLETHGSLAGKTLLCLGAGGVARAIAFVGGVAGATVVIANRTLDRAQALAAEVRGARAVTFADAESVAYDILVNGTSVGMKDPANSPWPARLQRPGTVVFDTVYIPFETRLLREARAAGATVIPGLGMFIGQAADQFRRFTGQEMDRAMAERILRERLAPLVPGAAGKG